MGRVKRGEVERCHFMSSLSDHGYEFGFYSKIGKH